YGTYYGTGTVGEYTTSGGTENSSLVSGLTVPQGIALSGSDFFVASYGLGTIGEYAMSGGTVNASLVSGLSYPYAIAVVDTPEPSTVALLAVGAVGLLALAWRRKMHA